MNKLSKRKKLKEKFIKYLQNNTPDGVLVQEWNSQSKKYYIYDIEEFNNITKDQKPLEFAKKLSSDFNLNHKYFFIDKVGKYRSFNSFSNSNLPIVWELFASNLIKKCDRQPYVKFLELNI